MSGLTSVWSDLKESLFPAVAYADEDEGDEPEADDSEKEEGEDGDDEDDDEDEDDDDDDDDDDEDELKDPLDEYREKFTETVCHSFKHHFDECVERVTKAQEEPDYEDQEHKEDCVEEFFHLQHCLNEHIAPILFNKLK